MFAWPTARNSKCPAYPSSALSMSRLFISYCVTVPLVHLLLCHCPACPPSVVSVSRLSSFCLSVSCLYIHCCVSVFTVHPLLCQCLYCTSTAVLASLLYIHCCVNVLTVQPRLCRCPACASTSVSVSLLYFHLLYMYSVLYVQPPTVSVSAYPPFPNRRAVGPSGFRATFLKMDRVLDRQQRSYPVHCFTPPFGLTHFRKNA